MKKGGIAAAGSILAASVFAPAIIRRLDHRREEGRELLSDEGIELEHDYVATDDGTTIHLTITGQGDKVVFLVHGWVCNEKIFRFQQRCLRDKYRVITVELRGHGRSTVPANFDYSTERLAKDLKSVIDHVDPDEFVICGFSMGGFTALKFYDSTGEDYHERLKALVLLDSSGMSGIEGMFLRPLLKRFYPFPIGGVLYLIGRYGWMFEGIRRMLVNLPHSYLLVRFVAFGRKPCGCHVELQREAAFNTHVTTVFLALKSAFDYQAEHFIRDVNLPVLLFVGSRDRLTSLEVNRRTDELLPDSRLVVFPDAGHDCLLERRRELNPELESFLEKSFA